MDVAEYLTPSETARRLGITPLYVRMLFDGGRLTGVRSRAGRLIDPVSIETFLEHRARQRRERSAGAADGSRAVACP